MYSHCILGLSFIWCCSIILPVIRWQSNKISKEITKKTMKYILNKYSFIKSDITSCCSCYPKFSRWFYYLHMLWDHSFFWQCADYAPFRNLMLVIILITFSSDPILHCLKTWSISWVFIFRKTVTGLTGIITSCSSGILLKMFINGLVGRLFHAFYD